MRGLRVYAIVETAIFTRCRIFPYTLLYTTLEIKPVETAVFLGFSGYSWSRKLATDVSKCSA